MRMAQKDIPSRHRFSLTSVANEGIPKSAFRLPYYRRCAAFAIKEHLRMGDQRLARMLRKASCISAAVEKRLTLAAAHALTRNSARSGLRSKRILLGSVTGTSTMGIAFGNGWWPLHRSR